MISKKRIISISACVIAMAAISTCVSATSLNWSVNLPRAQGNVTLIDSSKDSSSSYGINRIDFVGGDYDCLKVWVNIDGNKVYGKTYQYEGEGAYTMSYGATYGSGKQVSVMAENGSFTLVNVSAEGFVNIY